MNTNETQGPEACPECGEPLQRQVTVRGGRIEVFECNCTEQI